MAKGDQGALDLAKDDPKGEATGMTMPPQVEAFVDTAKDQMTRAGIEIHLANTRRIHIEGMMVNGFFDHGQSRFACAMDKPLEQWFQVFVHEYGHFLQYREKAKAFGNCTAEDRQAFEDWISTEKEVDPKKAKVALTNLRELEEECERIAVDLIRDNDLGFVLNPKRYTQKANGYLFFYSVLFTTRRWYDTPPYEVVEIVDSMRDEFYEDYWDIPDGLVDLVKKHCY
jgi:hypothetical protein